MNTRSPFFALLCGLSWAASAADPVGLPPLDWLAGHWCGGSGTQTSEELWLPPAQGELLGVGRTLRGRRMVDFEFLCIAIHEGVPAYLAQPRGRPPTVFALTDSGPNWVRFENPAHDFPTRIEYRREGERLDAEIAGPDGTPELRRIAFTYRPCAAPRID